jgi:hypothetical protein
MKYEEVKIKRNFLCSHYCFLYERQFQFRCGYMITMTQCHVITLTTHKIVGLVSSLVTCSVTTMAYPKNAVAITIAKPGGIDVLEKTEVPLEVKPDHVVIKVCAVHLQSPEDGLLISAMQVEYLGVNFIDTYFR